MSVTRIASRYAKSLIDLAHEQGNVQEINKDWETFGKVMENRDFALLVKSPIIKADKKQAIFDEVFNGKVSKTTSTFFSIILRKGREALLLDIAKEFGVQLKARQEISDVKLITASPLTDEALEGIRTKVLGASSTRKNIEIETVVDESLIGGFVIEFNNQRYDSSVASKLAALRKEFSKNEYTKAV